MERRERLLRSIEVDLITMNHTPGKRPRQFKLLRSAIVDSHRALSITILQADRRRQDIKSVYLTD